MLKRILLTTDTVGGVWRYSLELSRGFAARGIEIVLVTLGPSPSAAQRVEAASIDGLHLVVTGLPLDWLAQAPKELEDAARALADLAAHERADCVQLHAPAFVGTADWPAPVVAAIHSCVGTWWSAVRGGALPADLAWRAGAVKQGLTNADAIIAPSRSFAGAVARYYGTELPITTILNGCDPAFTVKRNKLHVLTAGRLWDPGKNAAVVDAAAALLEVPVLAAGPVAGPHGEGIRLHHMRWLGVLNQRAMAQAFASASVFVSMSRYEPFGLAVLEAAQAGCALVLADIPTFRELWEGAAILVEAPDAAALAATLRSLLRDRTRRAAMGAHARRRAASYTLEAMVTGTLAVHEAMRAQPSRRMVA